MKERKTIALKDIVANTGQLAWLPKNPRQWSKGDVDRTAASIREDPDFLEDRPVLVVKSGRKYIAFAGNLRREGAIAAGLETVPAVVYPADTDEDRQTVKRRALKDNGSFGQWDYDELANEWDDFPLADYGIPVWEMPEGGKDAGSGSPASPKVPEQSYDVVVHCTCLGDQLALLNRLQDEGYNAESV